MNLIGEPVNHAVHNRVYNTLGYHRQYTITYFMWITRGWSKMPSIQISEWGISPLRNY